jgi:hypothetical protein
LKFLHAVWDATVVIFQQVRSDFSKAAGSLSLKSNGSERRYQVFLGSFGDALDRWKAL